ncbi:MAG: chemotaxis protein CheW [Thermoleophilia bacterium]
MGAQTGTFFWGASEGGNLPDSPQFEKPEDTLPFVVFSLAGETFAVEITRIREIIRIPKVTWVPGAPDLIRGVINLRGNVVAVIDLAAILSLPASVETPKSRIIVAETGDQVAGMLVDSVSRVSDIAPSQVEPALRTLDESQRSFVIAQSSQDEKLIGILDLEQIMERVRAIKTENLT